MKIYGLIGKNIDYSFSRSYFSKKFKAENIPAKYRNFDLHEVDAFTRTISEISNAGGFNVTIPYKETIIPYLDALDPIAREIGAVNTIKIEKGGQLIGFNTDYFGFMESLKPFLKPYHSKALILGTGGASKAIAYSLKQLGIIYHFVSRSRKMGDFTYSDLNPEIMKEHTLLINCTPLGTFPNLTHSPDVPFHLITRKHIIFDLIYNPPVTHLMKLAKEQGATTLNGQQMLELQAEKAWEIWNLE